MILCWKKETKNSGFMTCICSLAHRNVEVFNALFEIIITYFKLFRDLSYNNIAIIDPEAFSELPAVLVL